MKVKFNGGIKDVPLSEVTAANYICPQREEKFWHVLQEKVEFDRNNGKRLSRPVLQKYDTKSYPATMKYLREAGYTITVLHDPRAWIQRNAQAAAEAAKAQAAAEAAKAQAEREAMKAELRAELLAELKAEKKNGNKQSKGKNV
jgi:nucleoid-associated protein YgaU